MSSNNSASMAKPRAGSEAKGPEQTKLFDQKRTQ